MREDRVIKNAIEELRTLREVATAYSRIASGRIKKERGSVLQNRQFQEAINEVFKELIASYAREVRKLVKEKGEGEGKKLTLLSHNGKTVAVYLSSNTGLFGDIISRTFNSFLKDTQDQGVEITIVGKLGLTLFLGARPGTPYTYFDLPDHGIAQEQMAKIIRHIVQYDRIKIYFGKFQSIVNQKPEILDISAETPVGEEEGQVVVKYLFEPTLEEILQFFEAEIFASQFEQSVRESQLAKLASRMLAMDRASENIKQELKGMRVKSLRSGHARVNKKQLDQLSSIFHRRG